MSYIRSLHADLNQLSVKVETFLNTGVSIPVVGIGFTALRLVFAKAQLVSGIAFIALAVVAGVLGSITGFMNKEKMQNCRDLAAMGVEYLCNGIVNDITVARELLLAPTLIGNFAWMGLGHMILGGRTFSPFYSYQDNFILDDA